MSFLDGVRLVFAGRFQADVSTVNNDVRHYDNASFEPRFQDMQTKGALNGWWNPDGSGAFRFIDCTVRAAHYADGSRSSASGDDPVVGMTVADGAQRTAAKLVDIDPQWQLASAPWGMRVRLAARDGTDVFNGPYAPHAFRDLWFDRFASQGGDNAASACFQSVISGVQLDSTGGGSRFLKELAAATTGGKLSIRFATFGYQGGATAADYTTGTLIGAIGPYLDDEPESFVFGRRFAPGKVNPAGISFFSGQVSDRTGSPILTLDLANALQITDKAGTPHDIGALTVGYLSDPELTAGSQTSAQTFVPLAEIPYRAPDWLADHGGIAQVGLSAQQAAAVARRPLALVTRAPDEDPGGLSPLGVLAIRETPHGRLLEAEPQVHRIDAGGRSKATFFAARYGAPLGKARIALSQLGRTSGQGGDGTSLPTTPKAPIPDTGVPEQAFRFPTTAVTGARGRATVGLEAKAPGNPRGYIDGQIYLLDFALEDHDPPRNPFDYVVTHVYDAFDPATLDWNTLEPVFAQYGNLYPIMSKGLFSFSDEAAVRRHAGLVKFSLELPIDDPNHMPATRDLSAPRRKAMVAWLDQVIAEPERVTAPAVRTVARPEPRADVGDGAPGRSKTDFAKAFVAQRPNDD